MIGADGLLVSDKPSRYREPLYPANWEYISEMARDAKTASGVAIRSSS